MPTSDPEQPSEQIAVSGSVALAFTAVIVLSGLVLIGIPVVLILLFT